MSERLGRRDFMKVAAGAGAALAGGCMGTRRQRPGAEAAPLNVAFVGAGGQGEVLWQAAVAAGARVAAFCDVDEAALLATQGREGTAGARLYRDFRVMLEAERELDAVFIATPNHGHAVQASWALARGCHVYVETPLARTLGEARHLFRQARKQRVALRVADGFGTAEAMHKAIAAVKEGMIGTVLGVYAWTARPVWPQGGERPATSDAVPDTLDWDLWLGGAPARPYKQNVYHRYNWRGWHDFGNGALGDIGSQLLELPFRALRLEAPETLEADVDATERQGEMYPKASCVRFGFAKRGRRQPAVTVTWHDGGCRPNGGVFDFAAGTFGKLPAEGCLLHGERGLWLVNAGGKVRHRVSVFQERNAVDFVKHECYAQLASPPEQGAIAAFLEAARTRRGQQDDQTQALTECILAGCVAQRVRGSLRWRSSKGMFADDAAGANALVDQPVREGWELL